MSTNIKDVLNLFEAAKHPVSYDDIVKSLSLASKDLDELNTILKELVGLGDIVKIKGNRFGTRKEMNLMVGKVQAHPDGYGFFIPDDKTKEDLYISPKQLREVMHGDVVIARRQISKRTRKSEGKIIRIIKRSTTHIIGKFERKKKYGYVIPLNNTILHDVYVPIEDSMKAKDGSIVNVEIVRYPTKRLNPEGRVVKLLGDKSRDRGQLVSYFFRSAKGS
ncbi:hypothetical protein ACFL2A_03900, partial [Thermodesulfobacteriota bacterium]